MGIRDLEEIEWLPSRENPEDLVSRCGMFEIWRGSRYHLNTHPGSRFFRYYLVTSAAPNSVIAWCEHNPAFLQRLSRSKIEKIMKSKGIDP